jgi:hypothetical protein
MNTKKLIEILAVQSYSHQQERMFKKIGQELDSIPNTIWYEHDGNIYATKGEAKIYPCMVSHMDTVHRLREDLHPLVFGDWITGFDRTKMVQAGIGGDDKVGVFITLECLRALDHFKAVFFRDEEVGCEGSYAADMAFFKDCSFVLQCDRKGNSDFVTNTTVEMSGSEFQEAILPVISDHGYKFSDGMMTDVMALKEEGLSVACANMSCGYHRPHTAEETVSISQVANCLEMCLTLFQMFGNKQFFHKAQKQRWSRHRYDDYTYDTKSGGWKKKDHADAIRRAREILSLYGIEDVTDAEAITYAGHMAGVKDIPEAPDSGCPNCQKEMVYMGHGGNFCEWCGMYEEDMLEMSEHNEMYQESNEDDIPVNMRLPIVVSGTEKDTPF